MFIHDDGTKMTFPEIISTLLIEEHGRTKQDAEILVKRYPQIIINGIMAGPMSHRAVAVALEMKENEDVKNEKRH